MTEPTTENDTETLAQLRECLRGGWSGVTGQVLAADGPVGEPTRVKPGGGYFYVFVPTDREVTIEALRFDTVLPDGRELSAEVPVRGRTFPAGGIAYVAVPDAPGLRADAPVRGSAREPAEAAQV